MELILAILIGAFIVLGIAGLVIAIIDRAPDEIFFGCLFLAFFIILIPIFFLVGALVIDFIFHTHIITYRAH